MNGLGQRLRTLRKAKKMTQEQVADILCVHRTTYTKYEKENIEPPLDVVCALSEIFAVTVDELLKPEKDNPVDGALSPQAISKNAVRVRSPIATVRRTAARAAVPTPRRCSSRRGVQQRCPRAR